MNQPEARTVELTYHRAKVDPNPDLLGCLALLIALPLIGYGLVAFFSGHDRTAIFWYGLPGTLLVVASIFTPRLSRKSDVEFAQSFEAQRAQARSKDLRAEDVLDDLASNPRPVWLFFRPFELENQLLAVSTSDSGVRDAPNLIGYPEEGFADPKHQPVDLFDRLQSGFTSAGSAAAVAVGRRPHPLHLDVGFVASTDADWRQHVKALAAAASAIVAMPWDTPGVLWETEYLTSGFLHKTIFVMPPAYEAIATLKTHGHLFPFPWFAVEANGDAPTFASRWARAIEPLHRHGLAAPAYNWHGLLFGYGKDGIPFSCRIPVHTREFLSVYAVLRERRNLA